MPHNSLGATYGDLGRYKEAIDFYIIALKHDNKHKTAKENLISALTYYQSDNDNPIIVINNLLKKLHKDITNNLENNNLETFFKKSFKIIDNIKENIHGIDYNQTQIYRRNSKNLNCERHHKVFNHLNIIPKFCFSCFKIQIEPKTVFELIKLFFIFDNFNFTNNNWRKCMIELRPKVQGTYKGFIYCSSMDESKKILNDLSSVLKKSLDCKISIKRGCSEFYNPFPNFKQTDKDETNFMNFEDSWGEIEKKAESEIKLDNTILKESISGFSISDFLIINHWLNYAKAINDISYKNVSIDFIHSKFVAKKISNQLELRRKQFLG
jgi:tetratricopeptide (TPR) repeat protein